MTREEAISVLERVAHTESKWPGTEDTLEALDMAISALRQQDVSDKYVEKMTNADRIRAMEGEKLAGFLAGVAGDKIGGTAKYWLQWLQQPAKADTDA